MRCRGRGMRVGLSGIRRRRVCRVCRNIGYVVRRRGICRLCIIRCLRVSRCFCAIRCVACGVRCSACGIRRVALRRVTACSVAFRSVIHLSAIRRGGAFRCCAFHLCCVARLCCVACVVMYIRVHTVHAIPSCYCLNNVITIVRNNVSESSRYSWESEAKTRQDEHGRR